MPSVPSIGEIGFREHHTGGGGEGTGKDQSNVANGKQESSDQI